MIFSWENTFFFWSRNLYLPFLSFILFGLCIYYVMSADFKLCIKCDKLVNILDDHDDCYGSCPRKRTLGGYCPRKKTLIVLVVGPRKKAWSNKLSCPRKRTWRTSLNISRSRLFLGSRQASFVNHTFHRLTFFRCPRFTNLARKFTITNSMTVTIIAFLRGPTTKTIKVFLRGQ
jgi:hypothetical protein